MLNKTFNNIKLHPIFQRKRKVAHHQEQQGVVTKGRGVLLSQMKKTKRRMRRKKKTLMMKNNQILKKRRCQLRRRKRFELETYEFIMRKPTICICENKDADQLHSYCEADLRLCFRYTESTMPLLSKSNFYSWVCVAPVRKPHCRFSHEKDQLYNIIWICCLLCSQDVESSISSLYIALILMINVHPDWIKANHPLEKGISGFPTRSDTNWTMQ